ncbi:MAG: hypothetical protein V4671_12830 [Armatimonadota bacterium]
MLTKAFNLRERLGQYEGGIAVPFPDKPKGMHWDTYYRLRWKGIQLENIQWRACAERFGFDTFTRDAKNKNKNKNMETPF